MQTRRSKAREVALQLLFQNDLNTQPMPRSAHDAFVRDRLLRDQDAMNFCESLLEGVQGQREKIDALLSASAENWKLHRMLPVDRNVLRLATYEMLFAPGHPPEQVQLYCSRLQEESFRVATELLLGIGPGPTTSAETRVLVLGAGADRAVSRDSVESVARTHGCQAEFFEGMGHDMPRPLWPRLIDAICDVAARADR